MTVPIMGGDSSYNRAVEQFREVEYPMVQGHDTYICF
jgi:molybdenum cofactor sulfurtransferase